MAEARLFAELQETKTELQRLKERVFSGTPTVHKDLSHMRLKKFLYAYSFYTVEEYLSQSRIVYCITKFLIIVVLLLRFYLCTLYKYVFTDCLLWADHISLYKLGVSDLCIIYINYYMYFIVKTHSVLCLLLSNDKFYIHFDGSLESWVN